MLAVCPLRPYACFLFIIGAWRDYIFFPCLFLSSGGAQNQAPVLTALLLFLYPFRFRCTLESRQVHSTLWFLHDRVGSPTYVHPHNA